MKKLFTVLFSFAAVAVLIYHSSCKNKSAATKTTACKPSPTYTADIKNILEGNCFPCHNGEKKKRGLDLSTYETSKAAAVEKNFLGSINHEDAYTPMPKNHDKLDDPTIAKISCWVKNGMPQ